jgi:hypothetical protein
MLGWLLAEHIRGSMTGHRRHRRRIHSISWKSPSQFPKIKSRTQSERFSKMILELILILWTFCGTLSTFEFFQPEQKKSFILAQAQKALKRSSE